MRKRVLDALRQPSLKLTIIAIVFVVLVPTLVVVAATLFSASRSFDEAGKRQLLETARTVARSTVGELELTAGVLQSLVHMSAGGDGEPLKLHNVGSFANGRQETHVLWRANGQWQLSADSRAEPVVQQLVAKAAQTGRMQVSDILMPAHPGQAMRIVLAMPSESVQNSLQVSTLITEPQHLLHALTRRGETGLSVILAIVDGNGRIIERSADSSRFIGKPVPDWQRLQAQPGSSGAFTARTLEGQQIIFAFQRIEGTPGWVAVVGESAASFNQRWLQPIWVMLVATAATILLALLLALLFARKALKPINLLATRAQRMAQEQGRSGTRLMADVPPTFVAEFEVLRQSLDQADQALQHSLHESRRAERTANEHLSVLQAAEEQARLGHWTLDVATGQLHCSDMLSAMAGGPREPSVMPLDDLAPLLEANSYLRMREAVRKCIGQGASYAMEITHFRRDGSTFAAYLRGAPVFDAEKNVVAIRGTLQDIGESKEQRDQLSALADNLPSGVIFRMQRGPDRSLTLQFLSAGLESMTGLSAASTLEDQGLLLQAIPSSHLRKLLRVLKHARLQGHVLDEAFPLHTISGDVMWIHCRAALRYSGMSGGVVWDGIARDVTAERAADAALHQAKDAAEAAERAKSDFLATMSHEIRTPMNSVIGMARLALRTRLDPRQRNYLEKINDSANVLLGIINDILDFSKIEAGSMALEAMPFRIEAVLETVAAVTVLKAEEKGVEITYAVDPGVSAVVRGDALRLGQVLTNLVSNAVKFTEAGDVVVRVSQAQTAEGVVLHFSVSDTGIGLSAAQASRLFQPFTQAESNTYRSYGGTGLGLAISKRLVTMMGGTIGVQSELGTGSTFFFTVCMEAVEGPDAAPPHQTSQAQARAMSLQGRRILIADDNRISRLALAEMADGFGMQATLVGNGQEALDALRTHAEQGLPFDMVVLDWRMPVMDGVEAARHIKTDNELEHMPAVLMVTAFGQEAMLQACDGMELQGVLHKPVTHSAMFNTLFNAASGVPALPSWSDEAQHPAGDLQAFASLRGKRVLVADDNALNREVATDFLLCVGAQVFTAVDGLDAIRCLQQHAVDVVLMDIQMPNMDGLTATREIRKQACWAQLPIIALTAQARGEDVHLSLAAGMNGHLTKPIDEIALYRTLMAHLGAGADTAAEVFEPVRASVLTAPNSEEAFSVDQRDADAAFAHLSPSPQRRAHLLRGFLRDFASLPQRFTELLAQSQWLDVAALSHEIKGSASYLHAHALCATADIVETAARGGQGEVVHQHAALFIAQVQACLEAVREALDGLHTAPSLHAAAPASVGDHSGEAKPGGAPGDQALLDLLTQLRPLVANGNFAANRMLEQLVAAGSSRAWSAAALAAQDAFEDLDIAQALQRLDEIRQQCQPNAEV